MNVLCAQSVYQCCYISHTVLSELYQEKLVTEDEVKRMKGGEDLPYQLVPIQYTKPPEVVKGTAQVLVKFGYNEEAMILKGWWDS